MEEQLVIPGLESLAPPKPRVKPPTIRQQITALQKQVISLDVEVTLLRGEVEGGSETKTRRHKKR